MNAARKPCKGEIDGGKIQIFSAILIALFFAAPCLNAGCQPMVRAEDNGLLGRDGKPPGPAIISSTPVQVPQLKFRFVDEKNQPVQIKDIQVNYAWKWLKYPYSEHAWGAWSDGYDFVKCAVEPDQTVAIAEYAVTPRGWYRGKYVNFPWSRKPRFDGIHLHVTAAACDSAFDIEQSDFERYQGKVAVIELACSQRPKISFTNK